MDLDLPTYRSPRRFEQSPTLCIHILGHFLVLASIDFSARGDRARLSVSNTSTQSLQLRVPVLHRDSALNFVKTICINHPYSIRSLSKRIDLMFATKAATGVMLPYETPLQHQTTEQSRHPTIALPCPAQLPKRDSPLVIPTSQPANQTFRNARERNTARHESLIEHPVSTTRRLYRSRQAVKRAEQSLRHNMSSCSRSGGWVRWSIDYIKV